MDFVQLLGLVAGAFTTIAFFPQVIKTYQSKSAKDLSLGMYSIFFSGVVLWLVYGILRNDLAVIVANAMSVVLAFTMVVFKLKYRD